MKLIHYVRLHNFKVFGEEKQLDLDQPSVLIGPNNSGKTSALQALALWNIGVKRWFEAKGASKAPKNMAAGLNRLQIIQVPVQEARYFWKNTEIRKGSTNYIPLDITIGLEFQGEVKECKMSFTHYTPEMIYCTPEKSFLDNKPLMEYAAGLNIEILYPMSGITTEETLLPAGRVNVLIGQGKTAEVLRNLCYQIVEADKENNTTDWRDAVQLMQQFFGIEILKPEFNKTRGSIELYYKAREVKNPLDISLAGRGQQQMLLLIAHFFAHKKSVILLDEPDAHLEILRQKTVFTLLKDLSEKNDNQVIIATHSEVVMEEAADINLVMIVDGEPVNLAAKKDIRAALRDFSVEQYYKARLKKNILYVEGSTDLQILREFAGLLKKNELLRLIDNGINFYYTQNTDPLPEQAINYPQGLYENYKKHFYAMKAVVPSFRGIAIFDSDGKQRLNDVQPELATYFWQRYEIENYFLNPQVITMWFVSSINSDGPLFAEPLLQQFETVLNETILRVIFQNNGQAFKDYLALTDALKQVFWQNLTSNSKLSLFLENVLKKYSEVTGQPILLSKGRFSELVKFIPAENLPSEIEEVLELITQYLTTADI